MAYAVKYRGEFTDNEGEDWKIDILEDGFAGSVTTMQMTGSPLFISWPSISDNIHEQNIRGSQATINVYAQSDFAYSDLFTSDNFEYKVNIYYDSTTLYWTGWVTANLWEEPYADTPYLVTINAVDGFGLLRNIDFAGASSSRVTAIELIYDILNDNLGYSTLDEYVNVYDTAMSNTSSDSALEQTLIETDLFEDYNSYDVIVTILKTFNACLVMRSGIPTIYRYLELAHTTMYGRRFTSATSSSAVTNTPLHYINRVAQSSNFIENGSGYRSIIPQVKEFNIKHDYHDRGSVLENYQFARDKFTYSGGYIAESWTASSGTSIQPYVDGDGVYITTQDTSRSHYIRQTVSGVQTGTTDRVYVSIDYKVQNTTTSSASGDVYIGIFMGTSPISGYWWTGSSWSASETYIEIDEDGVGPSYSDWKNYSFIAGDPPSGQTTLDIRLFAAVQASGVFRIVWGDVVFAFLDSNSVRYYDATYEISNAVNGQIIELEYDLGDVNDIVNASVMCMGSLMYDAATDGLTSSWSTYTGTGGGRTSGAEADPIIELVGGEIGAQFARPKDMLDLTIYEQSNDFLDIMCRIEDVLHTYSGSNRKFVISAATYDARMRKWNLNLNELL